MSFWFYIAVFLVLAVLVLAWSLLRYRNVDSDDQQQRIVRNVRLYQQRIEELQQERDEGYLTAEEFTSFESEQSRRLLDDVARLEAAPQNTYRRRKWLLAFIPVPVAALFLYGAIGAYPDWVISQQLAALAQSKTVEQYEAQVQRVHDAIEGRLKQRPDHVEYRILLARFAMSQENYTEAALHYGVLAELLPDDADALAYYAQAEFLKNGRKVTPVVAEYMDKALRINPMQTTVLGMQGIYAFEQQDYQLAIDSWQKLVMALGPNSDRAKLIQQGIAQAKKELGIEDEPQATGPQLLVKVDVDKSLHELDSRMAVFVYAKAVNGPPAPLAVQKLKLADLPATITLDDSMAMMAGMNISSRKDVIIGARISQSGRPIPQRGDWQVEKTLQDWQAAGEQQLVIKDQVK